MQNLRLKTAFTASIVLFLLLTAVLTAGEPIVNPWVITDRSVNCYDSGTIVSDVTAGLTDPQDRAIAFFRFFRRTMFPYSNRNELPYPENDQQHMFDFVRMANVYGYALCTQTSMMYASLVKSSGMFEDARMVGVPGHGTAEVKWNGRWHFMDPIIGAWVFRRDRREIAGIEDIVRDTTLLTKAVAERRASVPFCPWGGEEIYPESSLSENDSWFTYRKYGVSFLLTALKDPEPSAETETMTHTMAFPLRPGFRLTRMWDNLPGMYNLSYDYYRMPFNKDKWTPSPAILPPYHPDGGKEERDTLNFPIIKPYRKTINGRISYRYYANGVMAYEDNFADNRIFRAADSISGLTVSPSPDNTGNGALRCADSSREGWALFRFQAPYVFVGGTVSGQAQVTDGSWAAVYINLHDSPSWMALGVIEKSGDFSLPIPSELLAQRYDFSLRLKIHDKGVPGSVNLRELKINSVCQLNMYSLPFLAPGENQVTVLAESIPQGASLAVTYKWQELGYDRQDRRLVSSAGEKYTIRVAGKDYPRMKEITMECIPE